MGFFYFQINSVYKHVFLIEKNQWWESFLALTKQGKGFWNNELFVSKV